MHPLAMGFTLITQTILVCSVVALTSKLAWFSYILFLIFLGATLVLFIYVAALASNETFKLSLSTSILILAAIFPLGFIMGLREQGIFLQRALKDNWLSVIPDLSSAPLVLTNIYNYHNIFLTGLIILYLLLTLLVVVKIRSTFFGPLRLS